MQELGAEVAAGAMHGQHATITRLLDRGTYWSGYWCETSAEVRGTQKNCILFYALPRLHIAKYLPVTLLPTCHHINTSEIPSG